MKNRLVLKREGQMKVEPVVFGRPAILKAIEEGALDQLRGGACLPGVIAVLAMPDIHSGYGLPVGGIMVTDAQEGVVSPGAVGVDINCGVRAVSVPLSAREIQPHLERLLDGISRVVTAGVGGKSRAQMGKVQGEQFRRLVEGGVPELVPLGYATEEDVACTEAHGHLAPASLDEVSQRAIQRGSEQFGTLGSGNHFLEISRVAQVFDDTLAGAMGLEEEGVCFMVHCGSRGFGEQVCRDYLGTMEKAMKKYGISPPNKNLACVPISSAEGQAYLKAMGCAANFAWVNRQIIMHEVRGVFRQLLGMGGVRLVYDVAHNIAKFEVHQGRKVLVHRKGATRAFPAGHAEIPERYRATGQPAVVPGSMGTASYIVVGTELAMTETFGSVNHGAGRRMSRSAAKGDRRRGRPGLITEEAFRQSMKGIVYRSGSGEDLRDEAPGAYKDSTEVVDSLVDLGLLRKVAQLLPLAVLKG